MPLSIARVHLKYKNKRALSSLRLSASFSRPGLLTSSLMGREFSKSIAEAIRNDWQSNAPPAKYVRQLQALHDSCETFLDAPLDQLNPLIAVDLKNRCRNWQSSLNQLLRDLDEGRSFDEVRTEANALVERLTNVIESLG